MEEIKFQYTSAKVVKVLEAKKEMQNAHFQVQNFPLCPQLARSEIAAVQKYATLVNMRSLC